MTGERHGRLIAVELDAASLSTTRSFIDAERVVAVRDLLADNRFSPNGRAGSFRLRLSIAEGRLVFDVADGDGAPVVRHALSMTPLRRVLKDYLLVCEAHAAAAGRAGPGQVEAIDMGRRGLHNEGAAILQERLAGKIVVDLPTARRLFTLVCALHRKG